MTRRPFVTVAVLAATALVAAWSGTGYRSTPLTERPLVAAGADPAAPPDPAVTAEAQARLRRQLTRSAPRGPYVVVDRTHNRLYVREGETVALAAVCSVGSGIALTDAATGRRWVFDTPRGRFAVRSKINDPVWRKPDWAFIEAGLEVPTHAAVRFEYGALGEHALDLGDGYLIHGTLYERLLGRSVTHGCVRLGRDDLRELFRLAKVGMPVYIF